MGGVTPICRYRIYPTFFQKFFIFFLFFSPALGYIFYLNFRHFSPIFHVFSAYFSVIFGLILCCWSIGFAVLVRYGCLRVNGKFRQKAILLLVYDAPKKLHLYLVIVGYCRLYSENNG